MRVDLKAPDWATHLLSDLTDWNKAPVPVDEVRPFDLPEDAYFEYAWQDADGKKRADPENLNPILNPWWDFASNLSGPLYEPDPMAVLPATAPRGRVLRLGVESRILDQERRFIIYSPAGMVDTPLPHILFQDGKAYFGWGKVPQVLDVMLQAGRIGPAHLVCVPPMERTKEYAFNADYRRFLTEEILPLAEERAPCDGRRIAWGASLGGLLSAMLAWERPDLFQKVVTQSGAYLFSGDMDFDHPWHGREGFRQQVLAEDPRDIRWHLDCGTLEWLLESNRRLRGALQGRGMAVTLTERHAGHNWINWKNGLAAGMEFALPPGTESDGS